MKKMRRPENRYYLLIVALTSFISLFVASCKKDENALPEATNSGYNTFGMLVDGSPWIPHYPSGLGSYSAAPQLDYNSQTKELLIVARQSSPESNDVYLSAVVDGKGSYHFSGRFAPCSKPFCYKTYYTNSDPKKFQLFGLVDTIASNLTITTFDVSKQIASGVFTLTLHDSLGKALTISDGRFDAHFNKQ